MQGTATRVNARLPAIDENEIGTIVRKRYNNVICNGEVTHYYNDEKCTLSAMRTEKTKRSTNANSTDIDTQIETETQRDGSPDYKLGYTKQMW